MNANSSKLAALNPKLELDDGYFSLPHDNEVSVEFTNAAETQVVEKISAMDDCSVFSEEVEANIGDGQFFNVLKPQSLLAFDLSSVTTALEISQDFGNVCRLLAEKVDYVDSLKSSKNRARASAYRCSDLTDVGIINADLQKVNLPENYYDLIVLSDIESMIADTDQLAVLIGGLEKALTANGILLVNYQNPKPLSAWFGADQDVPYSGLYTKAQSSLTTHQWTSLLSDVGFAGLSEQAILPNAANPRTILSKQYVSSNASALNHFYGAGLVGGAQVNEYLLFSELVKTQDLYDLCDSYLIVASKSEGAVEKFYNKDFSHFSSPGRRRQWRTITTKKMGHADVNKELIFSEANASLSSSSFEVHQDLSLQQYQTGQSLAGLWLENLLSDQATAKFEECLAKYHTWLQENEAQFSGALYDILPFNLIVDEAGSYQAIDPEWNVKGAVSVEFVLFRSLFWFGFHNRYLLRSLADENGLFSLHDFVAYGLKKAGYDSDLKAFIQAETEIQSIIEKQFNRDAIDETLRLPIADTNGTHIAVPKPKAQVFWYDSANDVDFGNSVTLSVKSTGAVEALHFDVASLDTSFNTLRIDPVDRGGFFRINHIQILDAQDNELWSVTSEQAIASIATLNNASFSESHLGSLFIALNDDPQLVFDMSSVNSIDSAKSLVCYVTYHRGIDYTLAMQQLGQDNLLQKQFIDKQRSEHEGLKALYSELNDNFNFLKDVTEKQDNLIEEFKSRILDLNNKVGERQNIIDTQYEMMTRTTSTRVRLFLGRLLGRQQPEPETVEEVSSDVVVSRVGQNNDDYALWIKKHQLNNVDIDRIKVEIEAMPIKPVFSIVVPVYNIEEEYLMMAVDSVRDQLYPHWELCLVDDASPSEHIRPLLKRLAASDERIKVKLNKHNQGIGGASNDGLQMATGDYVGLLDHDDEITIDALYENAKVINQEPDVGFIYSDEDKMTMQGVRVDPFFKPDYSPDLLDSQNYICHFSVFSQDILKEVGGFRLGYDGSQDHDIIIRAVDAAEKVVHIPKVLYHWRKVPGSTADVYDSKSYAWEAGRKAVASRMEHKGEAGEVVLGPLQGTFQVKRDIIGNPKVSIVIPFKDKPELLTMCLDSIIKLSSYQNYEVIGVSNNSEQPETKEVMQSYASSHDNIHFVERNVPFNFSELCNYGVQQSSGDYVLLLNNDIEIRNADWLERLLEHAQRDEVGAVGGKLFFPDGRVQHAGVVAGMFGAAGHSHIYFAPDDIGYYASLLVTRNVCAVTGAMLMVSRDKYDRAGGLDEQNLAVAYNDVDFCLKLVDAGYRNIFTPFVHATHYESASRGYEDNPEKLARLEKERNFFVTKWDKLLADGDQCFNPNFDLECADFTIKL